MDGGRRYWFPAKRIGWGWGPANTWQGWAASGLWAVVLIVGIFEIPFHRRVAAQIAFVLAMVGLYILICYWKGEPPRWRRG
jgi:hypothetical protein